MTPLLDVRDLRVSFGATTAVDGVSWSVDRGQALGIAGESGSGKTTTALAVMGLVPAAGQVLLDGTDLIGLPERALRSVRGRRVAMVFQDPQAALNPIRRVGAQVAEAVAVHERMGRAAARARAVELLDEVRLPDPGRCADAYPHELSGGMRQRATIAMALAAGPEVLIADEPTASLDAAAARRVLDLLDGLRVARGMAVVLITHDLAAISRYAGRVVVLRGGRVVHDAPTTQHPSDGYVRSLYGAAAQAPPPRTPPPGPPLLEVRDLTKRYGAVTAVDGVSVSLAAGECMAVVGESGAGKTTIVRCVLGLTRPCAGRVRLDGADIAAADRRGMRAVRRRVQPVFQDPLDSLNPRMTVGAAVGEPLAIHRVRDPGRVAEMLERVGLSAGMTGRYPHELSGGQRQRVAIARALVLRPALVVLDEPVSSLDAPVQLQILRLLAELRDALGVSYLLVAHDLRVVRHLADTVAVLHAGRVVEQGKAADVLARPSHPATQALVDASPLPAE